MADFNKALPYVLRHEGGWSDDPSDPGGATNFGITLAVAQRHGVMTRDALKTISPEKVAEIYRQDYWKFDGISDQRVATKVFDMGVNMGIGTAVKLVQSSLNDLDDHLVIDGAYGPATEASINAEDPLILLHGLCMASAEHYKAIVAKRPQSQKYLSGWLKRAEEIPT